MGLRMARGKQIWLGCAAVLWLGLNGASVSASWSEPVRVAAAADLRFALAEVQALFSQVHPEASVEIIYGSSGRFRTQIEHGAPFDLYFSADIAYPRALQSAGLVVGDVMPYALGRLVLWSNTVDASAVTLINLDQAVFRRIAIANPRHAPYGARAEEALRAVGLWNRISDRLVLGESAAQALQMVQSGAAEVGVVPLSLALNPAVAAEGGYHLIDAALHAPLLQGFVVTRRAADKATALAFAEFMRRPEVRAILDRYGFETPTMRAS
ncbi:MAG: molybdate ABC transporter substrate-binding protein [Natronospirillum sp.]